MLNHHFFHKPLDEQKLICSNIDNKSQLRQQLIFYAARADLNYLQIRDLELLISFVEHLLKKEMVSLRNNKIIEDYEN